jgi:hypothetical protein
MLSFNCTEDAVPIAKVVGGRHKKVRGLVCIIDPEKYTSEDEMFSMPDDDKMLELEEGMGKFEPRLNPYQRSVSYVAGPSGSGKTTYALNLIKPYLRLTGKPFFVFSRTDSKLDPAFKGMNYVAVPINQSLLEHPIDITQELTGGSVILFDDCNTIQNEKLKRAVEKIMEDILEVGRKLDITIIITSHLVIPPSKNFARTIMNELQTLTVFPRSGSSQQINYALKTYFGFNKHQIEDIHEIEGSRWVTVSKTYPMYVLSEKLLYLV